MPLLTVTATDGVDPADTERFCENLASSYADIMESDTAFVAVCVRQVSGAELWLGRADPPDADIVLLEADVRGGRPPEQRRAFALAFMDTVRDEWDVPRSNMKVVFTEHDGSEMMGYDRVGSDWQPDDA